MKDIDNILINKLKLVPRKVVEEIVEKVKKYEIKFQSDNKKE